MIEIKILNESGYEEALYGLGLSYGLTSNMDQYDFLYQTATLDVFNKCEKVAKTLAFKGGGENKFLESMMIWIEVTAPRYWWSQADTYRLSTKQSESTMHTLKNKVITQDMFCRYVQPSYLGELEGFRQNGNLEELKSALPESFMQKRIWCMSYKTLQNIYNQRKNHHLKEWVDFCDTILTLVQYPEFIKE